MGEVIRFIPNSERERARLIREARAIYNSIFPPADLVSEQQDKAPISRTVSSANAYHSDDGIPVEIKIVAVLCSVSSPTNCDEQTVTVYRRIVRAVQVLRVDSVVLDGGVRLDRQRTSVESWPETFFTGLRRAPRRSQPIAQWPKRSPSWTALPSPEVRMRTT